MTTVVLTYLLPDILAPASDHDIKSAYALRYYFRGGADVICIQRTSPLILTVYIPIFSKVSRDKIHELINDLSKDIEDEEKFLLVESKKYFLFDTHTKKILTPDSFMDYIPYVNFNSTLFISQNENGSIKPTVMYLGDASGDTAIKLLPLAVAKRELMRPRTMNIWTATGKAMLTHMICKKHSIKYDLFEKSLAIAKGAWTDVVYDFSAVDEYSPVVNMGELSVNRAISLATEMEHLSVFHPNTLSSTRTVLLSEVLHSGVKSFCNGSYGAVIEVNIDVQKEIYNLIYIYTQSGTVAVQLNKGVDLSLERVKEDLNTDNVTVVHYVEDDLVKDAEAYYG